MDRGLRASLAAAAERYRTLSDQMASPEALADPERLRRLGRETAELRDVARLHERCEHISRELAAHHELAASEHEDPELRALAREELAALEETSAALEAEARRLLRPRDPLADRPLFLELRAGTGGDEAALFAADLLRMYLRWAERHGYSAEPISTSTTSFCGVKEAIVRITGRGAYARLRHESGVHRVQRVPETEAQGRIHTSTVTVAVLVEPDEVEVDLREEDLRIDVYRSSGPGGQSVNTTDSAVRITHLPTGIVVTCQDEKSQHKNRARARAILGARLHDHLERAKERERAQDRRRQVGSGDRSERIRTYNVPQGRVTDHRIGLTLHQIDRILEGDLDPLLDALATAAYDAQPDAAVAPSPGAR